MFWWMPNVMILISRCNGIVPTPTCTPTPKFWHIIHLIWSITELCIIKETFHPLKWRLKKRKESLFCRNTVERVCNYIFEGLQRTHLNDRFLKKCVLMFLFMWGFIHSYRWHPTKVTRREYSECWIHFWEARPTPITNVKWKLLQNP